MNGLATRYGNLSGISVSEKYSDGSLKSCILNTENRIQTPVGEIIPQYRLAEYGQRQKKHRASLSFFRNGQIKSAALDCALPLETPIGTMNAELVTFYEDGSMNRIFPLNGQIDGYWSEQNEGELAESIDFDLPVGSFSAKIINCHFYPSGALKSLTLWPGQKITIDTPAGSMAIRTGFSLYEDGSVRSVEPSSPVELATPIGIIKAYDAEMLGIHSDQNSVQFTQDGILASLKTVNTGLRVIDAEQKEHVLEPLETTSLIEMSQMRTVPMQIDFTDTAVTITNQSVHSFDLKSCRFETFERRRVLRESCGGCSSGGSCSDCTGGDSCCKNQ